MKRLFCLLAGLILLSYAGCYWQKSGDKLPTWTEYQSFIMHLGDDVKQWLEDHNFM